MQIKRDVQLEHVQAFISILKDPEKSRIISSIPECIKQIEEDTWQYNLCYINKPNTAQEYSHPKHEKPRVKTRWGPISTKIIKKFNASSDQIGKAHYTTEIVKKNKQILENILVLQLPATESQPQKTNYPIRRKEKGRVLLAIEYYHYCIIVNV